MKKFSIRNPVWIRDNIAYFSISDYTFQQKADAEGNLRVGVFKDDKLVGWNIVNSKDWIRTNKQKESKIVYRPNEPLNFFYNTMLLRTPLSAEALQEQRDRELLGI